MEKKDLNLDQPQGKTSGARAAGGDEDLLGVIAQVEQQLQSLKGAQSEREQMRTRLEEWEAKLKGREADLNTMTASLLSEQSRLAEQRREVEAQSAEIESLRERMEEDSKSLGEKRRQFEAELEKQSALLESRSQALMEREQTLSRRAGEVEEESRRFEARQRELQERETALGNAASEIESLTRRVNELSQRLAEAERQSREQADELREAQAAARTALARADGLAGESAELQRELKTRQDEWSAKQAEFQAGLERATSAQAKATSELQSVQSQLRDAQQQAQAAAAGAQQHQQALAQARTELDEARRELDQTRANLAQRDERITELSAALDTAKARLREISESLKQQGNRSPQADGLADELRARDEQIRMLKEQLEEARSAPPAELTLDVGSDAQVEALQAEVAELREQLEISSEAVARAQDENRRWRAHAEELRAGQDMQSAGRGSGATEIRHRRLRTMKGLLREQHEKLRRAGEVLRARHQELEEAYAQRGQSGGDDEQLKLQLAQVASERDQLASEREQVMRMRAAAIEAHRNASQVKAKAAQTRAAALVCYAVFALCGLLGLSWAIASHIAPATYAVRATLSMDSFGLQPSPDQLVEWQRYHESLLTDPTMNELAADRMGRRGIASLATPGDIARRFSSDLSTQSPQPGKLIFELRGSGAARTERELEVYVTAIASQANATRERRADGLGTEISQPPAAGEAISDLRVVYAGGIFGGGFGLASFLGFALWRRMAASKQEFESELESAEADEATWSAAPKVLSRPRT